MKKHILFIFALCSALLGSSQNWEWAKSYGTNNNDQASSMALDPSGNVFASGYFIGSQLILGTVTLNTAYSANLYVVKHNTSGTVIWGQSIGSNGTVNLGGISTGTNGNVYVCGTFSGPSLMFGTSSVNLVAGTTYNFFIGCFSSSGSSLWVKNYGSSGTVSAHDCSYSALDNSLYVTGSYYGNLAIGTTTLTNGVTSHDLFAAKFSIQAFNATPTWAIKAGSSTCTDVGLNIRADKQANIYIGGTFNPVTGTTTNIGATLTSRGSQDIFIAKYNSAGTWQWSQSFGSTNGSDFLYDMVLDTASNVYMTGSYNGSSLLFNTFFGTYSLTPIGGSDAFIAKFGYIGLYSGSAKIGGATGNETGYGLGKDDNGYVYVGGSYTSPSLTIGTKTLTNPTSNTNAFVTKVTPGLGFQWSVDSKGTGSANVWDLDADASGNVFGCGTINVLGSTSFGTSTLTSVGSNDFYVAKISCITPTITASNANYSVCINSVNSFTPYINSPQSDVTYSWSVTGASGVIISPTTGTTTTISYTGTASFSVVVTGTNSCSNVVTTVGEVDVNPLPVITVTVAPTSSLVCSGKNATITAGGASTYTWNPFFINGTSQVQTISRVYTVTATSASGCVNTKTVGITVVNNPTVSVTGKNLVCLNKPNTLTASGASTYTWLPGSVMNATINAQPASNTIYTVTGKDGNGCTATKTFTLNLVTPITPSICLVTVDSLSQYNHIVWDKTTYTNVDSFIVYREVSTNVYKRIGAHHKSNISEIIDTARSVGPANGNPNITSYRYKMQLRDSCGNYSLMGPYHNSIYFISNTTGTYFWNTYDVEFQPSTPVTTFNLLRDNNATGTWSVVGTAAGTQTSLNDPNFASYPNGIWRVEANGFSCNATFKAQQIVNKSKSNVKNNFNIPLGTNKLTLSSLVIIAPNPALSELIITFKDEVKQRTDVSITDVLGKVVSANQIHEGSQMIVPVNELAKGIYFVKIQQGDNSIIKKIVKD